MMIEVVTEIGAVRQTADPIHLMRLFGICDSTALKYVFAAHPERQWEAPR
ncbi:hypothetical protein [Actinoplanes regularis]|uniref:Uncharacterized protein n=1 Tax=Actinoplanes regularis TaxID=52697 RepID=A0A239FGZ7_9ACTN|nr:hypothetical protein [Actinoplanes regularis]GIE89594.1 hypothetical protein Are01nite_60740 [Actinoplanes regularis]SNS56077.1 hypothetical protein SAMN06264365_11874 [Actinoplanes regularis]